MTYIVFSGTLNPTQSINLLEAKFHYAIWFEAGSRQVRSWSATCRDRYSYLHSAYKSKEGRITSPCQIWSKSVKSCPRYGDFLIFQDGCCRHLGFSKFQIFNGRRLQEGRTASPCQIWPKSVELLPRYGDFYFSKMAAVRHLGFVV